MELVALHDDVAARIFDGLNEAQRAAVEACRGPVAILAGAGTGKTTAITRRIAWQVASEEFDPGQVLAVTFTQKAAREMGARLASLGVPGVRAVTFHAEALAQFRRFSPEQPEILSHKGQILYQLAKRLPAPHKFVPLRDIAGEIEWAKNRRIPARSYLEGIGTHEPPVPAEVMARIYVEYEKRKRHAGLIDFEDLLERTLQLLSEDARALGIVRSRYAAFTVDEYQDVNLLQQSLLDTWVGARTDVCVVGDDNQAIFGFTGATPQYLLRFASRYDQATVVALTENYRSTPEVLSVANRLVSRQLRATRASGDRPLLRDFDRGVDEVDWIVGECRRLHEAGTAFEEMAVLFRINGRSEDFEEAFARARIPYQVRDGSFLQRPAARAVLARLRRAPEASAAGAVARIAGELGHDPTATYESGDEATRQTDLDRLVALAAGFAGTPGEFVEDVGARFEGEGVGCGVHLMTYHRAKGLEFDAVFLPRLEDKELPFALGDESEERRLFYVGITRAKRHLAISYARTREGERRSKPRRSPFLDEISPREAVLAPASQAPASRAAGEPKRALPHSPLFDALREWRRRVAQAAGLPAYVVFHDATLAEIATKQPANRAELRSIPGVGPLKMQRYGEELLEILARAN